ncbi:uncharacterized protein LOC103574037 [Microplitis demolitor]|uniref:uncharacterized protein LOC103574037 n=1 Tax=Microplitis demolitor TaxID=69319 RepID=UPI00235B6122|nr:uncharacterized protein LOC103574037 [Microplitis demolitor]
MFNVSPKLRRLEFKKKNEIPKQSEIINSIGPSLTSILYNFSPTDVKKLLGVIPQLDGPSTDLWIPPSDKKDGDKIILKPIVNHDLIKALTHDGILKLGEQAKRNYDANVNKKINDNLKREIKEIRSMFEAEKRHAINLHINDTINLYESKIDLLTKEYESKLQKEISKVVENSNERLQKAVAAERMSVTHQMLKKLRDEIGHMVIKLYGEFEKKSQADRENIIADFNKKIRNERKENDERLNYFKRQSELETNLKKLELENKYFNRLINSINRERSQSETRMSFQQKNFQEKITALYKLLLQTLYIIKFLHKKLSQPAITQNREITWRDKLQEIINKFKKIINFVFNAIPGHAEFLLSLESLLSSEHDEDKSVCENEDTSHSVLKIIKNFSESLENDVFHVVEIIDKSGKKWRPIKIMQTSQVHENKQLLPITLYCEVTDEDCSDNNFVKPDNVMDSNEVTKDVKTFEELIGENSFTIKLIDSDTNLENSNESTASDKKSSLDTAEEVLQHKIKNSVRKSIEIITKFKEIPSRGDSSNFDNETDEILQDLRKYSQDFENFGSD